MTDVRAVVAGALGDRYELRGEVGRGGMATVYRATDRKLGRSVAVKVLDPHLTPLLGSGRFLREIAIAAALQHPNIVPLYESGGEGQFLYYTMPFVEGETLRARLERESQLPVEEALGITEDVAAALGCAHEQGVVHRDIKPENILLSGGRALVTDFGIARAISAAGEDRLTSAGIAIGTPAYMSPEQAGGQAQVDGRSDIYSLGCVLYEMLSGEPPFTGRTAQAVLSRQMQERPRSLQVVRPALPLAFQDVVEKMLAKVPADRYATAAALVEALEHAKRAPEGRAPVRRRLVRTAAAAAPVLLAAAVWLLWPRTMLDANKVMGFPLLARGGVAPAIVEQVEEAIADAMQDTDPLRWVRARLFLGAARGAPPADSATRLARARGARYWLGGTLSYIGDSLVVRLELFDAKGDSLLASRAEAGPRLAPAFALAFRAVNVLLPKIVGRSTHVDVRYLEQHPPAAVTKWLEGEVAYRNARYTDAMAYYREALALDSTLVPAALKGAMTAAWLVQYPAGDSLVQLALRREAELPPLNRMFAHGLRQHFAGNGDSALAWFRQVVRAAPEWSEGWYGVGEAAYHLWPAGDNLDSVALDAFRRSVSLDPDFAPVVFHLAELTIVDGPPEEAARLVERHRALSADVAQQMQLDVMLKCIRSGPDAVDWTAAAAEEETGLQLLSAGRLLGAGGLHPDCAERAYRAALLSPAPDADLSRRWNAALGLHHLYLARGETARARRLADSLVASGVVAGRGLRILEALLGAGPDSAGAAEIATLEQPLDSMGVARLWWFGQWAAHLADTTHLAAFARRLRTIAEGSGKAADRVPARVMAARLLLLRGDTLAAVDSLRAIRPVAPLSSLVWRYWEALASERLLLARLLAARGQVAEAIRVAQSFDGQRTVVDVAMLPASLELRRRAAERLGDRHREEVFARRLTLLSRR